MMENDHFVAKSNALLTMAEVAKMLGCTDGGFKTLLWSQTGNELYDAISDARLRIGRHTFFSAKTIAAIIQKRNGGARL